MTAHRSLILAVFLTVAPFVGRPVVAAQCDSCVLDFTGGSAATSFDAFTLGWKFTVAPDSTITIGGLGIFDVGPAGLGESHKIALWKSDATLLAFTTIDNANSTHVASTSNLGDWLFTSTMNNGAGTAITSLQLSAGSYVLGAGYTKNSPDMVVLNATASTIKGVTWDEYRVAAGLDFPISPTTPVEGGGNGYFGPNLFIPTTPVPEPKTYAMLMAGLVLLGFIARRRGKSLNAAA